MLQRVVRPQSIADLARRGRSWSSEHAETLALAAALLLIEALPTEAWLLVMASYSSVGVRDAALPFWYLLLALATPWALRRATQRRGAPPRRAGVLVFLALYLLLLRVSPATYGNLAHGPFDVNWLAALVRDYGAGNGRIFDSVGLLLALLYLWWRGSVLSQGRMTTQNAVLRFRIGLGATLVAVILATIGHAEAHRATIGVLAILLPALVYVGLVGTALVRAAHMPDHRRAATSRQSPWLRTTLALSTVAVSLVLALSLVVNADSIGALLAHAGPVGQTLDAAGRTLVQALATLLYVLFNGLVHALRGAHTSVAHPPSQPACQPSASNSCGTLDSAYNTVPGFWRVLATLLTQGAALVLIAAACVFVARRMLGTIPAGFRRSAGEERESLDAAALLRAQLRNLFFREQGAAVPKRAELEPGSVRALYRDVLEAAAWRELPRRDAETPDEYAARLDAALDDLAGEPVSTYDLRVLSEAYNVSRYAEREPAPEARASIAQRAAQVMQRLNMPPERKP